MKEFALYLFIFSVGAFVIPILSRFIRIPILVGEIIYGMLLRLFLYEQNIDFSLINFLSDMGFIFIMFLAGLEINFDNLKLKQMFKSGSMVLIYYVAAVLIFAFFFESKKIFILILLTASSVGIIFLGLKSNKTESDSLGQTLIWTGTLGELLSIVLLMIFELYHFHENSLSLDFALDISGIILLLIGAYVLIRLVLLFLWWFPESVELLEESGDVSELGVRLSFLVLLTMVALSAYFNLEFIIGAFLGGMMLSFVFRDKKILEQKLSSIGYGFFIPFFFMKLGWDFNLDINNLSKVFLLAFQMYFYIFLTRFAASVILIRDYPEFSLIDKFRTALAGSFLLAAPLTILVASAQLGFKIEEIDEITYKSFILCSMIGGFLGPLGYSFFYPKDSYFRLKRARNKSTILS
ncbi:MAG: cation:proton antiporter [Spirochaetia bacterium]|nr:cation:proton antiporter [Spirochaetia bacterium]